ncbi:MAG: restriction endonuclease subunit S [Opitutae bacterium]|nr:restriction endonuclease subunit S [Opitutae bacterium]
MKLETFFEKFDLFADAPDAVPRMRELVLWSAFSGAFSGEERSQPMPKEWVKEGAPELPAIPASWKWQRGSDVFDVIRGVSYKKTDASDFPIAGSFPLLRANNIGKGINFDELVYVPRDNIRDEQFVRLGDILIAMSSGSKKLVGKAAPVVTEFKGAFGAFCGVIRNKSAIPDDVLARYFQTPQYSSWVTAAGRGIGINNLGKSNLDSLPIPTPPLAEQKRIVAKVDELMALCDRLEEQQQEREKRHAALARASLARFAEAPTAGNLHYLFHDSVPIPPADLRKAILTLAVQGKLVSQDPNDEPAARLLKRIDAAPKRAMRTRTSDEPESEESTAFEPLFELPVGWEWAPFRRLPLHASVGIDRGRSMQGPDKAVGYFKMNNIRNSGGVDLSDLTRIDATPEEVETFALTDGDFLFNTRNSRELVGKTCVFRASTDDPILYNNNILRVRFIEGFSPDFLDYWFRSPQGSAELEKLKSNTTNVCAIYQGKLSGFPCVTAPLAEQRRIVAKVKELMVLVDDLETQLTAGRATATKLLSALVAELTGTKSTGKVSKPAGTGRRGRPRKST